MMRRQEAFLTEESADRCRGFGDTRARCRWRPHRPSTKQPARSEYLEHTGSGWLPECQLSHRLTPLHCITRWYNALLGGPIAVARLLESVSSRIRFQRWGKSGQVSITATCTCIRNPTSYWISLATGEKD
jgi:hypothetical protein